MASEEQREAPRPAIDPSQNNRLLAAIFLIGFVSLGYELLQARMLSFFLGSISNFLAIPIALFGLALGSMYCHFVYKGDPGKLISRYLVLIFPVMAAVLIVFFLLANTAFSTIHANISRPSQNAARLIVYAILFLPRYFLFGALLSTLFSAGAAHIGRLYFCDLAGAALGCFTVPLLFTYTDLPVVIMSLLFFALLLTFTSGAPRLKVMMAGGAGLWAVLLALTLAGIAFRERPNVERLSGTLLSPKTMTKFEEVRVRWNDIARTSLIRAYPKSGPDRNKPSYVVIQDDGISNVRVVGYDPKRTREQVTQDARIAQALPFAIGIRPKNILVMFAGTGKDMVLLDALAQHKARITGVELNHSVVDFTRDRVLKPLRLREFLSRDGINLVAREGRDFLNNSTEKYDLIFAATNGSVHATRTGHTRKYLDTYEAMRSYLDHLTPDGTMFFLMQPVEQKILSFRKLFKERGFSDIGDDMFVFGDSRRDEFRTALVKPSGLTGEQVRALIAQHEGEKRYPLLYAPNTARGLPRFKSIARGEAVEGMAAEPITDDNPFINKVRYAGFSLFPSQAQLRDLLYCSDWIKIFTVILFAFFSVLVIGALRFAGEKGKRLPLLWFAYFFVAGLGYMGVEIGLIAKVELFVGNPLYAMAVILAVFLLSNACGAFLQDKYRVMRGWKTLLVYTSAAVVWSVLAASFCNTHLLSIPMALKVLAVALAVAPAGVCLGMYYPCGVATLVKHGHNSVVPATYAIATLSSVVGSSVAMTAITNVGFSTVILCGAVCYASVAFVFIAARKFAV
jgi:hypothetical protein